MFLKFFKRPLPLVLATIIGIGVLLWLKPFLGLSEIVNEYNSNQMPFFSFLFQHLSEQSLLAKIVSFTVLLITSLYLIQLSSKFILIKSRTYLPALIYILLTAGFPTEQLLNPAIFASFFLALALNHLFQIYETKKPHNNVFMAGFFCALASLFYIPASAFLVLIFISLLITGKLNYRYWLISIFGFLTPWFFIFIFHYIVQDNVLAVPQIIETTWEYETVSSLNILDYIFPLIGGVILLVSIVNLASSLALQKISIRKYHSILVWFLLITIPIFFLAPPCSIEIVYIAGIPFSFQVSNYLVSSRSGFWTEFWFLSLFATVILTQIF